MVITILDAEVEEKNWEVLKKAYEAETINMPDDIHQTFLIQSKSNPTSWRIMTHWRSQEDLDHMRQTTPVPPAVKIFKEAGANPSLGVWDITIHKVNKKSSLF
jgi:hypothetical protein